MVISCIVFVLLCIRINDVILSVNGVSMVGVTHTESVQVLKQAGKTVVLVGMRIDCCNVYVQTATETLLEAPIFIRKNGCFYK